MSDLTDINLSDRPSNRFQVNPVNRGETKPEPASYRLLPDSDNEIADDDRFPEDASEIIKRRQSTRLSSLKSSFRGPERERSGSLRFKDAGAQTTRFQVDSDGKSDSDNDDRDLIDDSEARYGRSFRHFTREALPRLDNYRNILSIQAQYRPTLDELHNATITGKVNEYFIFVLDI